MRFLDLTLPTPAENLALDEALLDDAELSPSAPSILRIWEPERPLVVIGRSSKIREEVRYDACLAEGIPVLRRASGGAAIVTGPGCLMYALVLSFQAYPAIRAIDHAHRFVLSTIIAGLRGLVPGVGQQGVCDLAFDDCKFSGNSVRSKQKNLLYHGTILYNFPLPLIDRYLNRPPREPDYRRNRPHRTFVANLPAQPAHIRHALQAAWNAFEPCPAWPHDLTQRLAAERYSRPQWNESR
jgi:lipoate-protein ligase A